MLPRWSASRFSAILLVLALYLLLFASAALVEKR
jgi:hypothetical protein